MLTRNFEHCGARARSRGGQPCQAPPVLDPENAAAAEWQVQVAWGPINWAAHRGGAAADRRGSAETLAETCRRAGDHGRRLG